MEQNVEVQRTDETGPTPVLRPFQPLGQLAPPLESTSEGTASRGLSLFSPTLTRVLLATSAVLAPAAAVLPDFWNLAAAGVSMLLAALCGVAATVPRVLAGRLPVSLTLATLAASGAGALAVEGTDMPEGWLKALVLLGATVLSFVAGKPLGSAR